MTTDYKMATSYNQHPRCLSRLGCFQSLLWDDLLLTAFVIRGINYIIKTCAIHCEYGAILTLRLTLKFMRCERCLGVSELQLCYINHSAVTIATNLGVSRKVN